LGKGFLTGKIGEDTQFDKTDFRNIVPRFTPENRKANQAVVDLIGKFAQQKRRRLPRLLSHGCWRRSHGSFRSLVQPKLHRLEENIGATAVELTPEDLRQLEGAASKIPVQGARYPEELQKLVGR